MKKLILATVAAAALAASFGAANAQTRTWNGTHSMKVGVAGEFVDYDTRSGIRAGS